MHDARSLFQAASTNLRFPGVTTYYQLQPEKAPDRDLTTATFDCAGVRIGCLSAMNEIKKEQEWAQRE